MAHDAALAERIRTLLAEEPDLTEARMFGGLAFLVAGHLAIAASNEGGVLVRVDPATAPGLLARTAATQAVMRGRPMTGWLRVSDDHLRTRRQLGAWVDRSVAYVRTLPPKQPKRPKRVAG